jgi:glutaminyl-peptide cyclotransferase
MRAMDHLARACIRLIVLCMLLGAASCSRGQPVEAVPSVPAATPASPLTPGAVPVYGYKIIHTYPHDNRAFTEGLVYHDGYLYEGTGLRGQSDLRKVELATGTVVQRRPLDAQYFGEGVAVYGDTIVELTWQSHVGFVLDRPTFNLQKQFSYPWEGWGLTYDGARLIMSDGTPVIHFLDPTTFSETARITVTAAGQGVRNLNELEWVNGEIFANVWMTDRIARIAPATGQVTGWIDLTGLRPPETFVNSDAVLNGIAYDATGDRLFVTGKMWAKLYEIQLVQKTSLMLPYVASAGSDAAGS